MEPVARAQVDWEKSKDTNNTIIDAAAILQPMVRDLASERRKLAFNPKHEFKHSYLIRLAYVMGNKDALDRAVCDFIAERYQKNAADCQEQLEAYISLDRLNEELRNFLKSEFSTYFGKVLAQATPVEQDRLVSLYNEYGVEHLAFGEVDDLNELLSKIAKIQSIRHLDLSYLPLSGINLGVLSQDLVSLSLSHCGLCDDDLVDLPKNLEELILYGNDRITDKALIHIPKKIRLLSLCYCTNIVGTGLKDLGKNLEQLFLDGCAFITAKEIAEIPPSVKGLSLSKLSLTSEDLRLIPRGVIELCLYECSQITDDGIAHLPPILERVNIAFTHVEGTKFSRLPSKLKLLQHSIASFKGMKEFPHFGSKIVLEYLGAP